MVRTVAQKMGIKENSRAFFINPDKDAINNLELPDIEISNKFEGEFDYIHLFVTSRKVQEEYIPKLKIHLKINGMLWVSWPKNKQLKTDLTLDTVIKIAYSFGLVESTCLSINNIWSALKFTHPKKGKIYNNRHAELKERTTNR